MEAGEWYLMEDSWGSSTLRTKMRMASRRRGAEALATAVKALLTTAGNPSELSGTRIPSPRAIAPDVAARGAIGSVDGRPPVGHARPISAEGVHLRSHACRSDAS